MSTEGYVLFVAWQCHAGGRKTSGATRKHPSEADLAGGAADRQKKKRKRKPRLPKGFDPENPGIQPDPERWLPKWQRSDFKKKRNRRREKASHMGNITRMGLFGELMQLLLHVRMKCTRQPLDVHHVVCRRFSVHQNVAVILGL